MKFIYYSLTAEEALHLHFWSEGQYSVFSLTADYEIFREKLTWLLENQTYYKISYRGAHIEKPILTVVSTLISRGLTAKNISQKVKVLKELIGSPSQRLRNVLADTGTDYYSFYLELLTHPLMLDIETFDGRIYHNSFDRLEIQAQLRPARTVKDYLMHLELIFQTKAFQKVFQQKNYLLQEFSGQFSIPVNLTTTDAQLSESFYTQKKLRDAASVFIPQKYLPFTYFLKGNLEQLYYTYQKPNPKQAIRKKFGKNGALTQLGKFVISSGASAPIGFQIESFDPKKNWGNQIKAKHFDYAIRLDLTHIQASIMQHTVKDAYFQQQVAKVLTKWRSEPDKRQALNRLLYPIQGSMDTSFDHHLHTPHYAYSMRITHNLLLIGLLTTLVEEGMSPISLNNEVIFLETHHLNQKRFEQQLQTLDSYFDYRIVENLLIKDTNNYTYFDSREQKQVFRGSSFNHYEGADVVTNLDAPPIVDAVLRRLIIELGKFDASVISVYLADFIQKESLEHIKEYFMLPLYPLKNRRQFVFKNACCQEILSAKAFFVSQSKEAWDYRRLYVSKKAVSQEAVFFKKYGIKPDTPLKEVANSRLRIEPIDTLSAEKLDLGYYSKLIADEMALWEVSEWR
ncbi:hypothetical protein AB3331_02100 [Streptococcus sp. H49]|uniref:hypothetical protein n=1 Tax=Streptococcus huangxiaojuni TaxID=3237239 RepID=UPI0034A2C1F2